MATKSEILGIESKTNQAVDALEPMLNDLTLKVGTVLDISAAIDSILELKQPERRYVMDCVSHALISLYADLGGDKSKPVKKEVKRAQAEQPTTTSQQLESVAEKIRAE